MRQAQLVRHPRELRAFAQPQGAVQAVGEVPIAQPKPGFVAELREPVDQGEAVPLEAEAQLWIDDAAECIRDDVEVRRDVDAVELAVVAGVDDRDELGWRHDLDQSAQQLGRADPAGERHDGA